MERPELERRRVDERGLDRPKLVGTLVERRELGGPELERPKLERQCLGGSKLVGPVVERPQLVRPLMERWLLGRSDVGLARSPGGDSVLKMCVTAATGHQ